MSKQKPIIHNKRRNKIRIHNEGKETLIVTGFLVAAVVALCLWLLGNHWLSYVIIGIFVLVYAILLNFFRCPIRMFQGPTTKTVVAPADGRVVVIEEVNEEEYFHDRRLMISIFMSPVNVHANWIPCEGTIVKVAHQMIVIETPHGEQVMARQIAGAMARRIVTYAEEGTECYIDDHMGFIKFGSRVDVYLPLGTEVCVELGQRTTGDETIIAKLK